MDGIAPRVAPGVAEGQEYGLGGAWGDAGKPTAGKSWRSFDRGRVCGDGPCSRTTVREAAQSYAVGPPYVIHARDAVPLARAWLRAVPDVHAQYPYLLAEMYAYSMAAANLSLPHAQVHHLMVSNAQAGGEGWDWVDSVPREQIRGGAADSTPPLATRFDASLPFSNDVHPPGPARPPWCTSASGTRRAARSSANPCRTTPSRAMEASSPSTPARRPPRPSVPGAGKPSARVAVLCNVAAAASGAARLQATVLPEARPRDVERARTMPAQWRSGLVIYARWPLVAVTQRHRGRAHQFPPSSSTSFDSTAPVSPVPLTPLGRTRPAPAPRTSATCSSSSLKVDGFGGGGARETPAQSPGLRAGRGLRPDEAAGRGGAGAAARCGTGGGAERCGAGGGARRGTGGGGAAARAPSGGAAGRPAWAGSAAWA